MKFRHSLSVFFGFLFACMIATAGTLSGSASSASTTTSSNVQRAIQLSPANLRLPASAAECVNHVYMHGQGYYEHAAYGCSHPTAGYTILIWDYAGKVDGFHVYRTDKGRMDYGIHRDGTMAQIAYPGGRVCWVVAAVQGNSESADSNQYCMLPSAIQQHVLPH